MKDSNFISTVCSFENFPRSVFLFSPNLLLPVFLPLLLVPIPHPIHSSLPPSLQFLPILPFFPSSLATSSSLLTQLWNCTLVPSSFLIYLSSKGYLPSLPLLMPPFLSLPVVCPISTKIKQRQITGHHLPQCEANPHVPVDMYSLYIWARLTKTV